MFYTNTTGFQHRTKAGTMYVETRREKIGFIIGVILFNGLGLWTVYEKGMEEDLQKQLDREGVEIYATVQNCSMTVGTCQISYQYEAPLKGVSQSFVEGEMIWCDKCDQLNEIDIVPIRYLPQDPAKSRTIFSSNRPLSYAWQAIILLAFPWVWFVLTFIKLKWIQWRSRTG